MFRSHNRVLTPEDRKHGYEDRHVHDDTWLSPWREPWHRRRQHHMEEMMRDADLQFMRMERKMSMAFRDVGFPRWKHCFQELESELPEIVNEGDHKKYQVNLHMGDDFEPRDIKVKLKNHQMTVEAKSEHSSPDGHTRFRHEIQKKFTLPDSVEVKDVRSILEPDGVLHIEANMPLPAIEAPPGTPERAKKPVKIPVGGDEVNLNPSPAMYRHVRDNLRHVL